MDFRADDVESPWALTWRFQEVFKFLQDKLLPDEDVKLREVEYAAINGMLRTLDPHSILLTPDEYSEMQLSTRGEFGGLGIVISIRDQALTVMRPMPGTPAGRAGLKRLDRITKIAVARAIPLGGAYVVIPKVFRITHVLNTGAAFSLFGDSGSPERVRWLLVSFSVIAGLIVAVVLLRLGRRITASIIEQRRGTGCFGHR